MLPKITAIVIGFGFWHSVQAGDGTPTAINNSGLAILQKTPGTALVSPFSINAVMGMVYGGASGSTKAEMEKSLGFSDATHEGIARISDDLTKLPSDILSVANRIYVDNGTQIVPDYVKLLKSTYKSPAINTDIQANPEKNRVEINDWISEQTRTRIKDLIPPGAINTTTRIVLANCIYIKPKWLDKFDAEFTKPRPFNESKTQTSMVPTMTGVQHAKYAHESGYTVLGLPYEVPNLQFLIIVPDKIDGLPAIERKLTGEKLIKFARLPSEDIEIFLPKLKLTPEPIELSQTLQSMGIISAFNSSKADFSKMSALSEEPLYISVVYHKAFLEADETGTEAAAATAAIMMFGGAISEPPKIPIVRVDRPFLIAIQHIPSGTCLFLGRVTKID